MAVITADDTIITSLEAADYFGNPSTDRRIKTGFRLALEWLGIPIPAYAQRGAAYRPPAGRAVAAAFNADHGIYRTSKHLRGTPVAAAAGSGWQGPAASAALHNLNLSN